MAATEWDLQDGPVSRRVQSWEVLASNSLAVAFPDLRRVLDDERWADLVEDVLSAPSGDARTRVLIGWRYTLAAETRPEHAERVAEAKAGRGRRYTSEELKLALGL